MLINLHLENFLIIEKSNIDFSSGLNVITGETGSGKSILFDALGLIVGEKGNKESIRTGCDRAYLQATFEIDNAEAKAIFAEAALDSEDFVTLSREILSSGKSLFRVNDRIVSGLLVKALAPYLVNISGQHENQVLMDPNHHRKIIDEFGTLELSNLLDQVKQLHTDMIKCEEELKSFKMDPSELLKKVEFLQYQIDEIETARILPDEDLQLEEKFEFLKHFESIQNAVGYTLGLCRDDKNVLSMLNKSIRSLQEVVPYDEELKSPHQQLETAYFAVEAAVEELRGISDKLDYDEEALATIEKRLDLINQLKKKYGKTLHDIEVYRTKSSEELTSYQQYETQKMILQSQLEKIKSDYLTVCNQLTASRKTVAKEFSERLVKELSDLNFNQSQFEVHFESLESFNSHGMDRLEFYISTNPGEPPRPIRKTASGGELSRIMLAVKLVNKSGEYAYTQIFDEIDTGISGRTASAVGEKLKKISKDNQVILVTHLPQIAIQGDLHLLIDKKAGIDSTSVTVHPLSLSDRAYEVARMIGSGEITETTLANATEMINKAMGV